ncbi:MAG TPA: hypothetical protein VLX28_19845 [Thermoanaerobaculia bacterium]|nr:hypothetical protein [Thermoanaerobaculia bacterium]
MWQNLSLSGPLKTTRRLPGVWGGCSARFLRVGEIGASATGSCVFASTGCEQKYKLFALSDQPEPVLWIGEDVIGECGYSRLMLVALRKSGAILTPIELNRYGDWAWAPG